MQRRCIAGTTSVTVAKGAARDGLLVYYRRPELENRDGWRIGTDSAPLPRACRVAGRLLQSDAMELPFPTPGVRVLSVTDLTRWIRGTLEEALSDVWVAGEISNFRVPSSGHFYFCLKDKRSQISAVMFRSANQTLPFRPADGMDVVVRGRVSLYEVRGDLQLYADWMEPRGVGAMQLALEQLKQKLAEEGLFAPERKRPLPLWPRGIGLVTALNGAAVQDMLTMLRARWPAARVVISPVRVQGKDAGGEIEAALAAIGRVDGVEVIITGRGGGSLEDLWAFNEEAVARAIAASPIPVVTAIGHEIDVTIADLVADRRFDSDRRRRPSRSRPRRRLGAAARDRGGHGGVAGAAAAPEPRAGAGAAAAIA